MNRNVWLRTITSPSMTAIFGMWQLTHSLPTIRPMVGVLLDSSACADRSATSVRDRSGTQRAA